MREATSETYGPWVYFSIILLSDLSFAAFVFRSIIRKTQKYLAALFICIFYFVFLCDLFIQSNTNQSIFLPWRDWQPLFRVGLQVFVVCVQVLLIGWWWSSYWFDNLGFITEGNTYRSCAASSLPLWGNTDAVSSHVNGPHWGDVAKISYWRGLDGDAKSTPCQL